MWLYVITKNGAIAENSTPESTAARLEFKSCLQTLGLGLGQSCNETSKHVLYSAIAIKEEHGFFYDHGSESGLSRLTLLGKPIKDYVWNVLCV